jgi:hypothetical protein
MVLDRDAPHSWCVLGMVGVPGTPGPSHLLLWWAVKADPERGVFVVVG